MTQAMHQTGLQFLSKAELAKKFSSQMNNTLKALELKESRVVARLSETQEQVNHHQSILSQTQKARLAKRELRFDNYQYSFNGGIGGLSQAIKNLSSPTQQVGDLSKTGHLKMHSLDMQADSFFEQTTFNDKIIEEEPTNLVVHTEQSI